jgi:hypothetical protein
MGRTEVKGRGRVLTRVILCYEIVYCTCGFIVLSFVSIKT